MPVYRPCSVAGCPRLGSGGRCDEHRKAHWRTQQQARGEEGRLSNSRRYKVARMHYLSEHPRCADPFKTHGQALVIATVLDHITPHRGDFELFWNQSNWQGLCESCNQRKTAFDHGWTREKGEGGE